MDTITIFDIKSKDGTHRTLSAKINENGDLVLEGYDIGKSIKDHWGDSDYEYWLTIRKENIPALLLMLLKERFSTSSDLMDWLKEKEIEYDFQSYV